MRRNRGRRFDNEPKLNMKKVVATIVALLVIIMVIYSMILSLNKKSKEQQVLPESVSYFSAYADSKWGVINNKGDKLSNISYDEMVIIPDSTKNIFIVTYDVDYTNGTFKTKAINEKNEQLFSNYSNVSALVNYDTSNKVWYNNEVLKFEKDGKYGLIDFSGKEVLPANYEDISTMQGIEKTLILTKDGKYGLYNSVSKTVFADTTYTSVAPFGKTYNDGYIVKNENGKYGILGSEGKIILDATHDKIMKVSGNDKYVVQDGVKTKLISKDGTTILETGFDEIIEIDGDNLVIKKAGKYGIINTTGETLIDPAFDYLENCFGDYYIAKTAGNYGVIKLNKDICIEIKYKDIKYRNDIASLICENEDYTSDIYNRELKFVLTGTISKVDSEKGYIRARVGNEYKYYNLQYQEITNKEALKNNTLFLVKENGKYGYVNKDGQKVVDCIYDDAQEQNQYGFCAVNKDGKWGVLQQNGSILLEPSVSLDNNISIDFIGTWHLSENNELNTYVK
jgi:hypothetical protein